MNEQTMEPTYLRIKDFEGKTVTLVPSLGLYLVRDFMGQAMPGLAIDLGIYDGKYNPPMPYTSLTVSFGEYISVPNSAYIDTNNFPFADQLLAQGIAEETGLKKTSGFCTYPLWVFKEEFLQKIGGEVYQEYAQAIEQYDPFRDPFEDEGPEMDGDEEVQEPAVDGSEQEQPPDVSEQDVTKPDKMSVRQWQEKFRAGAFDAKDRYTQCMAGWYDWFCQDNALAGRLKKIGRVVMGVTDPFILDNYYVWFKNNCPVAGPLYDDVRFEPLSGERDGKYFVVAMDSPHEKSKWVLYTERHGFEKPEYECGDLRHMVLKVNQLGQELAREETAPPSRPVAQKSPKKKEKGVER